MSYPIGHVLVVDLLCCLDIANLGEDVVGRAPAENVQPILVVVLVPGQNLHQIHAYRAVEVITSGENGWPSDAWLPR